jgi:hypothetical protein
MRKAGIILVALMIGFFLGAGSIETVQAQSSLEGMKPYTPTRLEWLATEMNAYYRQELIDLEGYILTFIPLENQNTILIYVRYTPKTNREAMNIGINTARKVLNMNVKGRGWDSWLKVREQIEMGDKK